MKTNTDWFDKLSDWIRLNDQGQIVIETYFEKHFKGDLELLKSCIGDGIYDGQYGEFIDYEQVIRDYNAVMKGRGNEGSH